MISSQDSLDRLQARIGYRFKDTELLERALTHRSRGTQNYERLEFLGDSILGFVVAEQLFKLFSDVREGRLSRIRSSLVRRETLAAVAREMNLSDYLIMGEGELKSGGFNRESILADVVESMIAAIYLDAGMDKAREIIHAWLAPYFSEATQQSSFKDAKSRLQEAMQKRGLPLPHYQIIETTGEQHEQEFTVRCELPELGLQCDAQGASRRAAEQQAAEHLLSLIDDVQ